MDPNFVNPWAISASPVWWISVTGTGYNYVVSPSTGKVSFSVIVPTYQFVNTDYGSPTGSVTTAGATGMVLPNGAKASFLFSTLDGTISGWNSKLGMQNAIAQIAINNGGKGAIYPGLAILTNSTSSYILAPNFGVGNAVEVYDNNFQPTKLAGSFTDPNLPANYAPYSVHVYGSQVWVCYALRTQAPYQPILGAGNGIVSVFDTSGNFVARAITGGNLNAPWGVAFAPASFGVFSNDLLIGNFGDGLINVYDPKTYSFLGQLMGANGKSLTFPTLWELLPGGTAVAGTTAVSGGDKNTVYFTAGLVGQANGLFGGIASTTTAGSAPNFGFSASEGAATVSVGSSTQATISVAPVNGFSGAVSLACGSLPSGGSCSFSPTQLNVSAAAVTTGTVTIQTTGGMARGVRNWNPRRTYVAAITSAVLFPFASFVVVWRRRLGGSGGKFFRLLMIVFVAGAGFIAGCSSSGSSPQATPHGQSMVVVTATSGMVSQQATIALTVQ